MSDLLLGGTELSGEYEYKDDVKNIHFTGWC